MWLVERTIAHMKCLTVTVDDRTLFSGTVAEIQWAENEESVSVSARFVKSPGVLQALQKLAEANKGKQPGAPESIDSPGRPTLDVVRDSDEN